MYLNKYKYIDHVSKNVSLCIIVVCIKQHLNNILSSIDDKGKQHQGWVEKERCLYKKACVQNFSKIP